LDLFGQAVNLYGQCFVIGNLALKMFSLKVAKYCSDLESNFTFKQGADSFG
jgi:hypothetical protein